jgi:anthranilate phosphoribosyltransferase
MFDAKELLQQLSRDRSSLSFDQAFQLAHAVSLNKVDHAPLAAILALLSYIGEDADVVGGFAKAFREVAVDVSSACVIENGTFLLDIVGTGGDGHNTVNMSTAASILAASCGAKVAKHGSVSVSSMSGAADVLHELEIKHVHPASVKECIDSCGIVFLFAPYYHPALASVSHLRKQLGIRTVFNILGPLLNPAKAQVALLGVYKLDLLKVYAKCVQVIGMRKALIVHCCGLDEIAPIGVTNAIFVENVGTEVDPIYKETEMMIDPSEFGLARCSLDDLRGGTPKENAIIIREVFHGEVNEKTAWKSPVGQTIALNAGAGLFLSGLSPTLRDGYFMAMEALQSGKALRRLDEWKSVTRAIHAKEESEHAN